MTKRLLTVLMLVAGWNLVSCKDQPPPPKPHYIYTQEDFGMGRAHTHNESCNREIDRLLNETRLCYNAPESTNCQALQDRNSQQIARLKNSQRCVR